MGHDRRLSAHCLRLRDPAKPFADSTAIEFELRDITNVDVRPKHFHSTKWQFLDANHLTQDWQIVENGHEVKVLRLEFTRRK